MEKIFEMHARLSGRVQGVGFRFTAQDYAQNLGLKGTVRNLPDGSVEIIAQGTKTALEDLIAQLKSGPGRVDQADIKFSEPSHHFEDFKITH